jgi:predicted deacylase
MWVNDLGALVSELDIEGLRAGIHRLRLQIAEDGAGYPIALPLMVARGKKSGPTLGVVAALHGDEINGIPVIHRLFDRIEPSRLSGNVVAVLVINYPAFDRQQRRFLDGVDLNHICPGRPDGSASQIYAFRLVTRAIRRFDYMIDLHTASRGRVNSLYARADLSSEITAKLAHLLRPQIILHNRPRDGTLRGEADEMGIPAVTLEIGNPSRFQPEFIRSAGRGLRAVMSFLKMVKSRPAAEGREPIVCSRSHWVYTDRGGLVSVHPGLCDRLEKGEPLATLRNIFGDTTAEYAMPATGVIIGKQVNPVGYTGARIAHIGVVGKVESSRP